MSEPRPVPPHYREAFPAEAVQAAVDRLASELTPWARSAEARQGQPLLAICVLRGGFLFFADLLRRIPVSVEPAFVRCRSYSTTEVLRPEESVQVQFDAPDCTGRHVLLVDDICDSGRTLAVLQREVLGRRAAEVRTCTLIHRLRPDSSFTPDHVGFRHAGPEWFAGYGMDDRQRFMNYPAVYTLGS